MEFQRSLKVPCQGINHADYSADQSFFVASCEFSGKLLVIDKEATKVRKVIDLNAIKTPGATTPHEAMHMHGSPKQGLAPGASAMPQDVRLTPDGRCFLAADMLRNGVWVIDAATLKYARFLPTGMGAHGIYPSRDAKRIFVANRDAGSVSVLDAHTLKQVARWKVPGGGSPDMGGVDLGRPRAVAERPLRRRGLRLRHRDRQGHAPDPRRRGPARPVRVAPARLVLARPHRQHALTLAPRALTRVPAPPWPRPPCLPSDGLTPPARRGARAVVGWAP